MTIILFIFMSDIDFFRVCLMRDVLLLLSTILYDLWVKSYEYLMRRCEKAWTPGTASLATTRNMSNVS